jgi:hypothetical protein
VAAARNTNAREADGSGLVMAGSAYHGPRTDTDPAGRGMTLIAERFTVEFDFVMML